MDGQMQVQQGGSVGRATLACAFPAIALFLSQIGAEASSAAGSGILMGDLAIQGDLSGGVIADAFESHAGFAFSQDECKVTS